MTAKSHVVTTLNLAIIPMAFSPMLIFSDFASDYYMFFGGVILGSLLPDIDERNSYIGNIVPTIASMLNSAVGHRTITHNLFVWLFIISIGVYSEIFLVVGIGFGGICHVLEDSATNSGVKWALKPFFSGFALLPKKYRFKTNGSFESFVYIPIIYLMIILQIVYLLDKLNLMEVFL